MGRARRSRREGELGGVSRGREGEGSMAGRVLQLVEDKSQIWYVSYPVLTTELGTGLIPNRPD